MWRRAACSIPNATRQNPGIWTPPPMLCDHALFQAQKVHPCGKIQRFGALFPPRTDLLSRFPVFTLAFFLAPP
jgi:hypothetical protein